MVIIVRPQPEPGTLLLKLIGAFSTGQIEEIDRGLFDAIPSDTRHAVVDMSSVAQMGSSAVGLLVKHCKRLLERGGKMHLADMNPVVEQLLRVAGMDKLMSMHPTADAALSAIRAS